MWLKAASPQLLDGLEKIEKHDAHEKARLAAALTRSGDAIAELIAGAVASEGRVKGFKQHVGAFLGYMIAHESHHRGQIAMRLRLGGRPLDKKVAYGMWEWGSR
jgi:uncharacterized damage-inducible protein DinB